MSETNDCQTLLLRDWLMIVGVAVVILAVLLVIVAVSVLVFSRRSAPCTDMERQPLLVGHYPVMQRTNTYYQWNKPTPFRYEKRRLSHELWQERRESLLRRYAAA
ncbi:hypothetical protein BJV82DRAFT_665642 [Fennellomyces sp. T-0311]|nr:hypothetical protein BJV82DRAFT_665642 [Fennellomyces sp. T-0311]